MSGSPLPTDRGAAMAFASRPVRYPDHHVWYVLAASLDLMVTNVLINHRGFYEANAIAARIIDLGGFWGLIAFKFATVALVVMICEFIGGKRPETGRQLAQAAIAISALPVLLAGLQMVMY